MRQGLGQLRHLIDLLDGAVGAAYEDAGLAYRPRYTPVMRALESGEPRTIGQIAEAAGITQPAATQTVALMLREGLLDASPGVRDARQAGPPERPRRTPAAAAAPMLASHTRSGG
jgi:DNA-binding MarR family transcriptional regulator